MKTLSVCMIVRDEQETLERALASAWTIADEIVVVDTGSADATKAIAAGFTEKVFDLPWQNSFSLARNYSLCHATKNWILWLDADDFITEESQDKIMALKLSGNDAGYFFNILNISPCLPDIIRKEPYQQFRMFPNVPGMRFEGSIHESIRHKCKELRIDQRNADVLIEHHGYKNLEKTRAKIRRNNKILSATFGFSPDVHFMEFDCGKYQCLFAEGGLLIWEDFQLIFSRVIEEITEIDIMERAGEEINKKERIGKEMECLLTK